MIFWFLVPVQCLWTLPVSKVFDLQDEGGVRVLKLLSKSLIQNRKDFCSNSLIVAHFKY
jgi:hypothetical protein